MNIEQHSTQNKSSRENHKPDMICWHIADGTYNGTIAWEKNPSGQISSHYVLGKDGRIAQLVPLEQAAWTQGLRPDQLSKSDLEAVKKRGVNPNFYCISIECEGFWKDTKGALTPAALKSAIELTKHIVSEVKRIYGIVIPIDRNHIIGHCQINPINRKHCPGELFPYDDIIKGASGAVKPVTPSERFKVDDIVLVNGRLYESSAGGKTGQVIHKNYRAKITRINEKATYPYLIDNGRGWAGKDNLTKT